MSLSNYKLKKLAHVSFSIVRMEVGANFFEDLLNRGVAHKKTDNLKSLSVLFLYLTIF